MFGKILLLAFIHILLPFCSCCEEKRYFPKFLETVLVTILALHVDSNDLILYSCQSLLTSMLLVHGMKAR